ncbi:MAG: winged helix DNA-binding domain-containing protein [Spirochaetaceae bacterium]|nr:winged helix DNA-binding domain-containing protein [Spirochaetaceae bacterium]
MTRSATVYPLAAVRALALHAQGLCEPLRRGGSPSANDVYAAVERVGWVQIDTLQVVRRAQYLTLWSRLGTYDPGHLDRLLFEGGSGGPDNGRRLFENWMHAACIIPLTHYRLAMPMMRRRAEGRSGWHRRWVRDAAKARLLRQVMARIEAEGPLRPADIRTEKKQPGTWWNWDDAKIALEHLYDTGALAISNRINFQRVYDLRDRVLPAWVDRREPAREDALAALLAISSKALGICTPAQVAHYFHARQAEARPIIDRLLAEGRLVTVTARLADRADHELVVHRDNLELLQRAADGDLRARRTTFLSPFDSLFWANGRDQQMWRFRQVLECYKPRPQREWGYFCLPLLDRDRLVGRFDPKLERTTGLLRLKKLYLEPGVRPSARLATSVARAMRDFMRFHAAGDLAVEHSEPSDFGARLTAAL